MRYYLLAAVTLLLAACGGGGSSSGGGGAVAAPVSITPSQYTTSYLAGTVPPVIQLVARNTVLISQPVTVVIVDSNGVLLPHGASITQTSNPSGYDSFNVNLTISPTLKPGHYTGNFSVNICYDSQCSSQVAGAPFPYPYDITVSTGNLTALSAWPGIADWSTFQGNAQHTGFVPVTLDPGQFSTRWAWNTGFIANQPMSPIVSAGNMVYFCATTNDVYALNEADGSAAWTYKSSVQTTTAAGSGVAAPVPATAAGVVYAPLLNGMVGLNAATGAVLFQPPANALSELNQPTVNAGTVYATGASGQESTELFAFNASSGAPVFSADAGAISYLGLPSFDSSHAYASGGVNLLQINPATAAIQANIAGPATDGGTGNILGQTVVGASGSVIALAGVSIINLDGIGASLVDFNTNTQAVSWSHVGGFFSNPAYANGVIYIVNSPLGDGQADLEAVSESTGALLWSWPLPQPANIGATVYNNSFLITNNLAFVSTNLTGTPLSNVSATTYAIDLGTQQEVWSYPAAGDLALSANGVLYINNILTGGLVAINVK